MMMMVIYSGVEIEGAAEEVQGFCAHFLYF
jgi:hypothetical protein